MANTSSAKDRDAASRRAVFYAPEVAFDRPVPKVPPAVFWAERERAFAPSAPTGLIACDLARQLGSPWPATTPTMLARYAVVRVGEPLRHQLASSGEVYYVLRGHGETQCEADCFAWNQGDVFCLPGGRAVEHRVRGDAILLQVTNEPELAYLRAAPAVAEIEPTLFLAEETQQHLKNVHGRNGEQLAAGKYGNDGGSPRDYANPLVVYQHTRGGRRSARPSAQFGCFDAEHPRGRSIFHGRRRTD